MLLSRIVIALAIPAAIVSSIAATGARRLQSSDEELIREARARSNRAIAAHDLPAVAAAWTDDVHIVSSTSAYDPSTGDVVCNTQSIQSALPKFADGRSGVARSVAYLPRA